LIFKALFDNIVFKIIYEVKMSQPSKTIIVKALFQSYIKNTYGIFMIVFKGNSIESTIAVAGKNSSITSINLAKNWTEIEDFILTKIETNESEVSLSQKLREHILARLKSEKEENLNKIIHLLRTNNRKKLNPVFIHILDFVVSDKNMTINFNIEEKTEEEVERDKKEKQKRISEAQKIEEERSNKEKFNIPLDAAVIKSFLVLAPVNGIEISKLKAGDSIYIKADISNENTKYIAQSINAVYDDVPVPIPAKIHNISRNDIGEYLVAVKVNNSVFSVIEESEEVKIKPYDASVKPAPDKQETKKEEKPQTKDDKKKKPDYNFIIIIGSLAVLLAVLIILFIKHGI
jgi:hypothetical protein